MKPDYKPGDTVWFFYGNHSGEMTSGKILEELDLTKHGYCLPKYYLVEVPNHIDNDIIVRDPFTLSPTANGKIGLMSLVAERYENDRS